MRKHVPHASVVLTLSPVPLAATFRGVSCVTANAASKATLRAAVDVPPAERAGRSTRQDSVDGLAEHQLDLTHDALAALIGDAALAALRRLPADFAAHGPFELLAQMVREANAPNAPE